MPWWRLFYHLIWTTRERLPLISPASEDEVHRALRDAADRNKVQVHAIGMIEDHVHMVVTIPPSLAIATAVKNIKGASAHTLNQLLEVDFGWQREYGVVSFDEQHLQNVTDYALNQRQHHAAKRLWRMLETIEEPRRQNESSRN